MYNKIILRQKGKVGVLIPTHSTCIKPLLNTKDEDSEYIQKSCTPVIRKLFVEFNSFFPGMGTKSYFSKIYKGGAVLNIYH